MISRRHLLTGLYTALGSSFLVGTGAFSRVSANRSVIVEMAEDDQAFLSLAEVGSGGRSLEDDGQLQFTFPGISEDDYGGTNPGGVGRDSVYRFGSDAGSESKAGLFVVGNDGTQPVSIYSTQSETEAVPSVTMYDIASDELLTESSPTLLNVGERLRMGLEIDTHDLPPQSEEYNVTLTVNAVASED